jgi:putative membrane protein
MLLKNLEAGTLAAAVLLCSCNHAGNQSVKNARIAEANNQTIARDTGLASAREAATPPDSGETSFMKEAARGGMMEVALGKLAEQTAHIQRIQDFARMIVYDHSHANGGLRAAASDLNVKLPDSLDAAAGQQADRLSAMKGIDFDRSYMQLMVEDHQKDIQEFRDILPRIKHTALQHWVSSSLPMLEKHLDSARAINDWLKSHPHLKNFTQSAPIQK